jgi:hypothetical protein
MLSEENEEEEEEERKEIMMGLQRLQQVFVQIHLEKDRACTHVNEDME